MGSSAGFFVTDGTLDTFGAPEYLRSDNGSEFLARTLAVFLAGSGSKTYFIKPGSPSQNGFIESFNSRLRAECLDVELFHNLADAQIKLAVYRRWYNEGRPHSSMDMWPPPRSASDLGIPVGLRPPYIPRST